MTLQLYDTAQRKKRAFTPQNPERVTIYVCGPTVYDYAHIGNARPFIIFDVLVRLLRRSYPKVVYARNITDLDDKINAAAKANGEDIAELTARTTERFHQDMAALGILPPDAEPRATQYIPQMIRMIERLMEKGNAYEADGHVLFDVPAMKDYGALSGRDLDDMKAGARVAVEDYKRNPADFVLWKPSSDDLPGWDSPWGRGRPGWHLECSAMNEALLGDTIDIHGGGQDLIFPHHENEMAQSVCVHDGAPLANYWMHNGYLNMAGDKMSKSLGNIRSVRELLAETPGEVLRYTMLSAHYRQPLDWSEDGVVQARAGLDRLYTALRGVAAVEAKPELSAGVQAALEDDLNTPKALAALHALAGDANRAGSDEQRARAKSALLGAGEVLGLLGENPEAWFKGGATGVTGAMEPAEIESLIARRAEARGARDFAESDRIRDVLADNGIVLEDGAGTTTWRRE